MSFTRVKPPTFKVGRFVLNEYEVRTLMVEVQQGLKESGITVTDSQGLTANINKDGSLSQTLYGFGISTEIHFELLRGKRKYPTLELMNARQEVGRQQAKLDKMLQKHKKSIKA